MPVVNDPFGTPMPTYKVLAASSSVVPRQKLKTPLIAGSVCGGVMGIAWIIGFTIYFRKRYKRKMLKRKIESGKAVKKSKPPKIPEENVLVPPDPAVILGHHAPGDRVYQKGNSGDPLHSDTRKQHLKETESKGSVQNGAPPTINLAEEMTIPPNASLTI